MAPSVSSVAGGIDADFHHQLGFHQRLFSVSRLPHPAENDQPVDG
ncbi:hypothetical protein ACI2L1_43835 [Streptomyces sp. NPDC019531]